MDWKHSYCRNTMDKCEEDSVPVYMHAGAHTHTHSHREGQRHLNRRAFTLSVWMTSLSVMAVAVSSDLVCRYNEIAINSHLGESLAPAIHMNLPPTSLVSRSTHTSHGSTEDRKGLVHIPEFPDGPGRTFQSGPRRHLEHLSPMRKPAQRGSTLAEVT